MPLQEQALATKLLRIEFITCLYHLFVAYRYVILQVICLNLYQQMVDQLQLLHLPN